MPELDFVARVNDTESEIRSTLRDAAGAAVDLTGASVRFRMRSAYGPATLKVDQPATIDAPPTAGNVTYQWVAGNLDTPGLYIAEWKVTFPGGVSIETFPNDRTLYVLVSEGLTGTDVLYTSLAELKALLRIKGGEHDAALMNAASAASRHIDARTRRRFYPDADALQVRKFTPVSPDYVQIDDLITLTSLSDLTGSWTVDTDFYLQPDNAAASGRPWDTLRVVSPTSTYAGRRFCRGQRVTVTGKFGWASPPPQVRQAAAMIAGQLFLRPQQAVFGVVGLGFEGEGQTLPRFDPHVETLLAPFVRSAMVE